MNMQASAHPVIFTGAMRQICQTPVAWLMDDFLSDLECQHLIDLAKENLQISTVVDPDTGEYKQIESRSSSLTFLRLNQDPIVSAIEHRIANLVRIPVENGEGLQVLRYQIGQEYKPHYDYFDPALPGSAKALEKGGQRMATVLMYLAQPEAGGETTFPNVNLVVPPKKGGALLFYSTYANGEPDPSSLHSSVPVIAGEKWVATKWIRQRAYI